jgi:guanylate kinase
LRENQDLTRLLVLAGPSGVGKGTVVAALRELLPALWLSVSVTTRAPRPGEVDGEHYLFIDHATYAHMVADDALLEHDEHFGAGYGTPRGPVEAALAEGRPALLEIDYEGARQVKAALGERALLVMLVPPSVEELERRLRDRGTEDATAVEGRLDRARAELAAQHEFEVVLENADVGKTAHRLLSLVQPH